MEIGEIREEKEYKPKVHRGGEAPGSEEDHEMSDSSLTGCVSLTMRCVVGSKLEFCTFFLDNHSQSSKGPCTLRWLENGSRGSCILPPACPTIHGILSPYLSQIPLQQFIFLGVRG